LSDIIFSSVFKIYSTVSGRRFATDLREAKARGYLATATLQLSIPLSRIRSIDAVPVRLITLSAAPLKAVEIDFAVDSSGFSTGQFMRWLDVKYGKEEDRRMWLKFT
jgi:hypothetical protein